jgi:hypothetical protein
MAFNPFRAFRKHQKVFMAGLVFVAMLTFVVAGSSGYFLELTGWFRGSSGSPQVAVVYGKPVYTTDIVQLRQQRELANLFIVSAISQTNDVTAKKLMEDIGKSKLSKQTQDDVRQQLFMRSIYLQNPQFAGGTLELPRYFLQMYSQLQNILFRVQSSPDESADAGLIQQLIHIVEQDIQLISRAGQFYFGGTGNEKDLLDFLIWQRQADRLGIQLSRADISALIGQETQKGFTAEINKVVQQGIRQRFRDLKPETLDHALAAEFRARLAQEAVLGAPVAYFDQYLPSLTPYDFWNLYRDERAESTVALLPIPVGNPDFVRDAGEPTPDDLKTLFEKGKDRKYNPANPEAGFKQPTRVLLEWVSADPDSPHYKRATEFAVAATQATMPLAYEMALESEYYYLKYRYPSPSWNNDYWRALHDSSLNRPQNVAAGVGQALAASGIKGAAGLTGWMAYQGSAAHYEFQDRLRHQRKMVLAWMGGSPWVTAALTYQSSPKTEYLPLEQLKPIVVEKYKESVARKLVSNAMDEVQKDLRNLSHYKPEFGSANEGIDRKRSAVGIAFGDVMGPAAPLGAAAVVYQQQIELARARGRAASAFVLGNSSRSAPLGLAALIYRDQTLNVGDVRKRVAEDIEKYALKHGQANDMRDQFDLGDDPGLAPLKPIVEKAWGDSAGETKNKPFGERVLSRVERGNLYDPQQVSAPDDSSSFLYWKTKDSPEYVPPFDEVKDQVAKRWKFEKARTLARQEAEEIVKWLPKGTNGPDVERALRDPKRADKPDDKTHGGSVFELDQVARLVRPRFSMQSRNPSGEYEPYKIPQDRVEHPSQEMVKKILDLKDEGEAVVIHDQPEATYYVAVLVHRSPTYEIAFQHDAAQARTRDTLLREIDKETKYRAKQREGLLAQLRKEALRDVDEENLKKASARREEE